MHRIEDNIVYRVLELEDGGEVLAAVCHATKLIISGDRVTITNNVLSLKVTYRDWQGNLLLDENQPVHITVTGPGQAQELVLMPTNGQAEFDFVSAVAGTFKIRATAEFPCDPTELEVAVT